MTSVEYAYIDRDFHCLDLDKSYPKVFRLYLLEMCFCLHYKIDVMKYSKWLLWCCAAVYNTCCLKSFRLKESMHFLESQDPLGDNLDPWSCADGSHENESSFWICQAKVQLVVYKKKISKMGSSISKNMFSATY